MSGHIFLLQGDNNLVRMQESPYDSEALLQELLARYPDLLAGDQIDTSNPRRWLLVCREMAIADGEDGSDRWFLDHLFIDQEGIPTLVEVKRSTDTRIRREVVGQMLDYAANAVLHWPVETIRARFEQTCESEAIDSATALATFIGTEVDAESFWQMVKTNLQAEKIRLVFVADAIPAELRRVVEFLNRQMDPAQVLALEVKQYVGQAGLKTLVPRLVGQTAAAQQRKGGSSSKREKIGEATFLTEMEQARGIAQCDVAKRFIEWSKELGLGLSFYKNPQSASFIAIVETNERVRYYPVSINTNGNLCLQMTFLRESTPFNDEGKRCILWQKLNEIPGVEIPLDRMTGYPTIPLNTLTTEATMQALLATLTWLVSELRGMAP